MKFNKKLVELREKNKLTQEDLAGLVGTYKLNIVKWEKGSSFPDDDKLNKLSHIFNVDLEEFKNDDVDIKHDESKETNINKKQVKNNREIKNDFKNCMAVLAIIAAIIICCLIYFARGVFIFKDNLSDEEYQLNLMKENSDKAFSVESFNSKFEVFDGEVEKDDLIKLMDTVIKVNKESGREVNFRFNNNNLSTSEDIESAKGIIKDNVEYSIINEYDSEGYIFLVIVKE